MDDHTDDGDQEPPPGDSPEERPTPRMLIWARNSAAYRLGQRMMSEQQLRDAIQRKAKSKFEITSPLILAELADEAVRFGREMGALDDQSYAEVKARSANRSGKSRRRIAQILSIKGVDGELVQNVLANLDDLPSAIRYARKRSLGPFRRSGAGERQDSRQTAKEMASLARNGFSFDVARKVLAMSTQEAQDVLMERDRPGGSGSWDA